MAGALRSVSNGFDPRAFVASAPWRFAKTMPQIPHWYTIRGQTPGEDFEAMVRHIRAHGYEARWGRYLNTYLDLDGWKYWTMGAPVAETTVINRERLDRPALHESVQIGRSVRSGVDPATRPT